MDSLLITVAGPRWFLTNFPIKPKGHLYHQYVIFYSSANRVATYTLLKKGSSVYTEPTVKPETVHKKDNENLKYMLHSSDPGTEKPHTKVKK